MTATFRLVATPILVTLALPASAATVTPFLMSDQGTNQVLLHRDRNGDGDTNDAGEVTTYFDAGNGSGLASPTANVFALTQARDGAVFVGDGTTDTIYRVLDADHDGSANGADEAQVWFSGAGNASGFRLNTPNGLAEGPDGAVYVVEADTTGSPTGDWVYRTQDLNGDGDANDAGEATRWLDLKAINPSSSPFEIVWDGDTAYITDTAGTAPNVIYSARDANGDGVVEAGEVGTFATEGVGGSRFDFALAAGQGSVFTWEWTANVASDPELGLFRFTDLDGSGTIDGASEVALAWSTGLLTSAFDFLAGFSMDLDPLTGDMLVTSNDSSAEGDWVIHLQDLDGDGLFLSEDEWSAVSWRADGGTYPDRVRDVAFYADPALAPVPLPAGGALLLAALGSILVLRRRTAV